MPENKEKTFESDRILSYFQIEWRGLLAVTISGLIYNLGLIAGPWFEGKMTGCLVDILKGTKQSGVMLYLVTAYVAVIAVVQISRYIKRFYVRRFANNVNRRMKQILYRSLVLKSRASLREEGEGDIMTKAILDVDDCAEGMRKFTTEIFDTGVALAAYAGMLLWYDWRLALLCMIFPPVSYITAEKMKKMIQRTGAAYKKQSGEPVLKDINLQIASGETIGILGGTGSAKSSLVNLVSRLYDVTEGSVRVGGVDVRNYGVEALRNQVAVVLQNNVLFSGTILDNLRWGDPEATEEECKHACELACADEFIQKMPKGYHTYIEQGGTNVSGGQKQRLCIARALLKKPKVLILDDSTSAVDTATDASIRRAFAEEIPGTTKLIIAQRISSIQNCDRIIVMEDGRVNDFGTHEELLARNQIYQEINESQAAGNADFDEPGKE